MGSDKIERSSEKNWNSAIKELMKGRELAVQLGALLLDETQTDFEPNSATRALTTELMGAFSKAIAALDDGGPKRKIKSQRTAAGHRRRSNPYSCTKRVAKTLDDGHSWRKYGQKEIYNAKYTRSYFRCTHKYDQGCVATRQVQRSEEDPSLYVITYFGDHTCRDPAADLLLSSCLEGDSFIIDFAKAAASGYQDPTKFSVCKQEESTVSNHPTPGSSSSELCFEVPELGTLEESAKLVEELLGGRDHGDVSSKLKSPTGDFGFDFMEGTFEFSDFFSIPDDVFVERMVE